MPRPRALSAVSAVAVVAAATVALLAGGGKAVLRTPGATSGSSPSQTPAAPKPATGTIAFARHAGGGMFGDAGGPVVEVTPDGAVVGRLPLQHTCCLTPSTTTGRFAVLVAGAGPLRLMSTGGGFTYPIPLPTGHPTLRLTPGAWSPNGKLLAMTGVDPARPARDGVYSMSVNGRNLRRLTTAPARASAAPARVLPRWAVAAALPARPRRPLRDAVCDSPRRTSDEDQQPGGGDLLLLRIAGQLVPRRP